MVRFDEATEALQELEAAQDEARNELLIESKYVFLRLGMLYAESNQTEKAKSALREFLSSTAVTTEENMIESRKAAQALLQKLN